MGILKNGPNGGFSGKVGSVIGYQLNGQDIIRSAPKKRSKKPSLAEQKNRDKFALLQSWLKPLLDFLRIGFKNYAPTYQGFVAAKSYNSKYALKQNEEGLSYVEPSLARLSFGNLSLPQTLGMECNDQQIEINWSKEGRYRQTELAMLMAYVPTTGMASYDLAAAKRSVGKAIIKIPDHHQNHLVHVYIAFVDYDQAAQSHSFYLGAITA